MDRRFSCPQGHQWSRRADDPGPHACPTCGSAPGPSTGGGSAMPDGLTTTQHSLVPGYHILAQAGIGDMAVVFKARDVKRNRIVAVKVLRSDDKVSAAAARRFEREVHCLASLDHPNIVRAFEAGTVDGVSFLVMEYLEGGSLGKRLTGTPWPAREAAQLFEPLARAVHHVHGRGIIHRNLKPRDILFAADGTPKLIAFGLAHLTRRDRGAPDTEGTVVGTPDYMAPEQAAGRISALAPVTDVYGLGAILYECLTGQPPFRNGAVLETLRAVQSDKPVPPHQLHPPVDRGLEAICLRCLEKIPEKRYASAQELAEDLGRRSFSAGGA